MKIEVLNQYRFIVSNIIEIQSEINSFYDPITSPQGHQSVGGGKSVPDAGNPTEKAVFKILDLKRKLEEEKKDLASMIEEIDRWLETIADLEVKAIIRWHFLQGKTWAGTAQELYGEANRDQCRRRFYQFKRDNPDLFE